MSARAFVQRREGPLGERVGNLLQATAESEVRKAKAINVSLVHRERMARVSLSALISGTEGFLCVGVHARLEGALERAALEKPHVVLLDVSQPDEGLLDGLWELRVRFPRTESLVLVPTAEPRLVMALLEAGASGCQVKPVAPVDLLESLAAVHLYGVALSSEVTRVLLAHCRKHGTVRQSLKRLTDREVEILEYLSRGFPSKEIARACAIGVQTVNSHLARIYDKLGVRSRAGAVGKFLAS
jgi:DNA-binding NarL/FixJ family response regulator